MGGCEAAEGGTADAPARGVAASRCRVAQPTSAMSRRAGLAEIACAAKRLKRGD